MLAVTPDGNTAFTTNEGTATISRLDVASHSFIRAFDATPDVEGVAVARGGRDLWVGEIRSQSVSVRDADNGTVLTRFDGFGAPNVIRATPDGRTVVIADLFCATLSVAYAAWTLTHCLRFSNRLAILPDHTNRAEER